MRSRTTSRFRAEFAELPEEIQEAAREAFRTFLRDPRYPGLEFKPLKRDRDVYSVRIGIHHRALARRRPDGWAWFWIGTHADYDKLLRRL